jgi:glycerol-3-phosphate dehydrogenase (NAD(P)+)
MLGGEQDDMASIAEHRENLRYLPGFLLTKDVRYARAGEIDDPCDMCVIAVPSGVVHEVLPYAKSKGPIVIASKGLEPTTDGVLSDLVEAAYPDNHVVALSGPNLAVELAQGIPTVAVAACTDEVSAALVRDVFFAPTYRVYISDDIKGVELAGALKNVLAIGAGISDGLGFGDNTKGALLARGLNEVARIGLKLGARLDTFLGIAGVGDLFATASSKLSRNYRVGLALGQGQTLQYALTSIGQVAEGVTTCQVATRLARKLGVQAPICEAIEAILNGKVDPRRAVSELMERLPRREGVLVGDAELPGNN